MYVFTSDSLYLQVAMGLVGTTVFAAQGMLGCRLDR